MGMLYAGCPGVLPANSKSTMESGSRRKVTPRASRVLFFHFSAAVGIVGSAVAMVVVLVVRCWAVEDGGKLR